MEHQNEIQTNERIDALFERIVSLIEQARQHVYRTVNMTEVKTRFEVGRYIFEDEQQGGRAAYGARIMQNLSQRLMAKYGNDWTIDTLTRCRKFFVAYNNPTILATVLPKLQSPENQKETNFGNSVAKILSDSQTKSDEKRKMQIYVNYYEWIEEFNEMNEKQYGKTI